MGEISPGKDIDILTFVNCMWSKVTQSVDLCINLVK